ncbi:hypothetical protein [uncultured Leifsonia sp.]|jgi:hypothetical protein|uniref:hypothetical protein n=1 Tax=uncultured Leifsonia sp. TaxID=340359 RepID=UPI0025F30C52|nr:hypothetical protein [uncultured Leifsonia sp.]
MTLLAEPIVHSVDEARFDRAPRPFRFGAGVLDRLHAFRGRCTVVRLATLSNERLAVPRWYTLAEAWAEPGSAEATRWTDNPVIHVGPSDPAELVLATGTPVIVVGVAISTAAWQRAVVDAVRSACERVLVVDMAVSPTGAPAPGYADVQTFGHHREHGAELVRLLSAPS